MNYVERARPFLQTVCANGGLFDRRFVVTVGFVACDSLRAEFDSLEFVYLPGRNLTCEPPTTPEAAVLCWNEKGIIQHGEFLRAIPADPDDVILFTDSDMLMQRPPMDQEIQALRSLEDYEVGLGPCAGPGHDALMQEAMRLYPLVRSAEIQSWIDGFMGNDIPTADRNVYCTGVVAATRKAWWMSLCHFMNQYQNVRKFFGHYARIQWLMSAIFDRPPFKIWSLPYTFTAHGCYGIPPGVTIRPGDRVAVVGEVPIMFRHAMP